LSNGSLSFLPFPVKSELHPAKETIENTEESIESRHPRMVPSVEEKDGVNEEEDAEKGVNPAPQEAVLPIRVKHKLLKLVHVFALPSIRSES
jgi:hypothetical protein